MRLQFQPVECCYNRLLDISRATLDSAIQHYISDNILDYVPSSEDLEYPARLFDTPAVIMSWDSVSYYDSFRR